MGISRSLNTKLNKKPKNVIPTFVKEIINEILFYLIKCLNILVRFQYSFNTKETLSSDYNLDEALLINL